MDPRQTRRERREAERKAKKLELKKTRLAENHPLAAVGEFPDIQPRWNPELEDEFPREVQIRNNALFDRHALELGLPIPPPGPAPGPFLSRDALRDHYAARARDQQLCPTPPAKPIEREAKVASVSPSRAASNRANAQLSTGPRSITGKLSSSRNSTRHGLASGQLIIPGEDPAEFESLLAALLNDRQPANGTEELLVTEMAQSHWLAQRAIRLQNSCFTEHGVDEKGLALYLRYFTTHNRAFHKALADLQRTQKERLKAERGFVWQTPVPTGPNIGFVSQNKPEPTLDEEFVRQNDPSVTFEAGFVSQTGAVQPRERTKSTSNAA